MTERKETLPETYDPVEIYLEELRQRKTPLLTSDKEKFLGQQIQAGLRAEHNNFDHTIAKAGKDAQEEFIESNLALVVRGVKKYMDEKGAPIPMGDLIQGGNIGLGKAVVKYEPKKGFRFSTYATPWINQGIQRTVDEQARSVRIPVYLLVQYREFLQTQSILQQKLLREPKAGELASKLRIDMEKVCFFQQLIHAPLSLNNPIDPHDQNSEVLGDILADDGPSVEEIYEGQAEQIGILDTVWEMVEAKRITEKDFLMFSLRFGFFDGDSRTSEDISRYFISERGPSVGEQISRQAVDAKIKKVIKILREEMFGLHKNGSDGSGIEVSNSPLKYDDRKGKRQKPARVWEEVEQSSGKTEKLVADLYFRQEKSIEQIEQETRVTLNEIRGFIVSFSKKYEFYKIDGNIEYHREQFAKLTEKMHNRYIEKQNGNKKIRQNKGRV